MLFAQQQFAEIAAERIAHIGDKKKRHILDYADLVLKRWQYEQADAGMVELPPPIGRGLLSQPLTLAKLAKGGAPASRRVPVDSVAPHECAGGFVACPSDLLLKLWGEKYPPAVKLAQGPGIDVAVAALIERDAATMPIDSLAHGIRILWIAAFSAVESYREGIREIASSEKALRAALETGEARLRMARDASKATRAQAKKRQDASIRRYVADEVKQRPGVDTATLTGELWKDRERHGITSIRTAGGLKRRVATERTRALKSQK